MRHNIIAFTLALTLSSAVLADSSPIATTGLFTLSANQSVQLHLLNLDDKACIVDLTLWGTNSSVNPLFPSEELAIPANGQISSLPYTLTTITPTPPTTQNPIRVELDFSKQLLTNSTLAGCGKLIPTLETTTVVNKPQTTSTETTPPESIVAILDTNFYGMPSGDKSESYKVKICHKPGTSAEKTLEVASSAVNVHKSHGDKVGSCANDSNDDDDDNDDKGKNRNKD